MLGQGGDETSRVLGVALVGDLEVVALDDPACMRVAGVRGVRGGVVDRDEHSAVGEGEVAVAVGREGVVLKPGFEEVLQVLVVGQPGRMEVDLGEHEVACEHECFSGIQPAALAAELGVSGAPLLTFLARG